MKTNHCKIAFTLLLTVHTFIVFSQCDGPFNKTLGIHYTYLPGASAVGIEAGLTGNESKLNAHIGVMAFLNHRSHSKVENDLPPSGRLYSKIGYRFLKADYSLSMYGNLLAGIDLDKGFFSAVGLKLLHPVGSNAISIEPMYVLSQKGELNLQLAFHVVL